MAVIQISKIQQRRGRKLSDIGVPQLSSGEFAWAVDTQELFIGNGSIAEGAPYVGNTKVLTEHDNILELASSYRFAEPDINITESIERSLQSKLDEYVSILDFGAVADGSTDCTEAFDAAFSELFLNTDERYKKPLFIPNGTYLFTSDLKIPSGTVIRGENPEKTILNIDNNNIVFISENGTDGSNSLFDSSDRPHSIVISNLTINHGDGQTVITASRDCKFENVKWMSDYSLGDVTFIPTNASAIYNSPVTDIGGKFVITVFSTTLPDIEYNETHLQTLIDLRNILNSSSLFNDKFVALVLGSSFVIRSKSSSESASYIDDNITFFVQENSTLAGQTVEPVLEEFKDGSESVNASVYWDNRNFGVATTKNSFYDCSFESVRLAIECRQDLVFDTEIDFDRCKFFTNDTSIYVNGKPGQGNFWNIKGCSFERIANQAVFMTNGRGTKIISSRFKNCGNANNDPAFPVTSIVKFGEKFDNVIVNCSSDRHQASAITSNAGTASVVEFENVSKASLIDRNYSTIFYSEGFRPLAVFPAFTKFIVIDYFLSLGNVALTNYSRIGQLFITIGDDLSGTVDASTEVAISDNYVYSPSTPSAPGGSYMTDFEFTVELTSNNTFDDSTLGSNIDTILLSYRNPSGSAVIGNINYSITYGV